MTSKSDALWPDNVPLNSLKQSEKFERLANYFEVSAQL